MAIAYPGMEDELLRQLRQQQMMSLAMNFLQQSGPQPKGASSFGSRLGTAGAQAMDQMQPYTAQAMNYSMANRRMQRADQQYQETMAYQRERDKADDAYRQEALDLRRNKDARSPLQRNMEYLSTLGEADRMTAMLLMGIDPMMIGMLGQPEGEGGAEGEQEGGKEPGVFRTAYDALSGAYDKYQAQREGTYVGPDTMNAADLAVTAAMRPEVQSLMSALNPLDGLGLGMDFLQAGANAITSERPGAPMTGTINRGEARTFLLPQDVEQLTRYGTVDDVRTELKRAESGELNLTDEQRMLLERRLDELEKIAVGMGG